MDIYSLCPLRVGTLLWEAQPDQLTLTVTVKATFTLVHGGEATLAPEQDAIGDDRHWDNNALASLHRPGDSAPLKPKVDVVLVGHAYAPGGAPVTSLAVRLRVGDLVKSLRVNGDRSISDEGGHLAPGAPASFTRMPLRYERALLSADNPVGVDPHAPAIVGALAFPNIEPEGRAGIAGFGPVAPTWRARRKLLDDASLFWAYGIAAEGRVSAGPAPTGFNFAFFNAAPRDQQIEMLRGGAPIELDNLHPSRSHLATRLPALRPQVFRVHPKTGRAEEIVLRCDTLWIDTDRGLAVQSFRGLSDLGGKDESLAGKLIVAADPQGKKLRFEAVEERARLELGVELRPPRVSSRTGNEAAGEADPLSLRHDAVKAPRSSAGPASVDPDLSADALTTRIQSPVDQAAGSERAPRREERSERTQDISQMPRPRLRRATLPFQDEPESAPRPPPLPGSAERRAALPFSAAPRNGKPSTPPPPPAAPQHAAPLPLAAAAPLLDDERTNPDADPDAITASRARRPTPPPPPMMNEPRVVIAPPSAAPIAAPSAPPAPARVATRPPPPPPVPPAPAMPVIPTMLSEGALAEAAHAAEAQIEASKPSKVVVLAPEKAPDPAPEGEVSSPEAVTIEVYAAISAELAKKGVDRAGVLRRHRLTIAGWGAVDRRFSRAMAEQAERGERDLQAAFDSAYVNAQGQLKKPIGVPEYARILVGLERGEVGRVLVELELQLSDLMRLQRVWTRKLAEAPKLAAELSRAVEAARKG